MSTNENRTWRTWTRCARMLRSMRSTMQIPLEERTEGENYLSGNKSVSGVRLNHYKLSDDGRHLEIDLSITMYRETKGDIRVLYKGATNVKASRK